MEQGGQSIQPSLMAADGMVPRSAGAAYPILVERRAPSRPRSNSNSPASSRSRADRDQTREGNCDKCEQKILYPTVGAKITLFSIEIHLSRYILVSVSLPLSLESFQGCLFPQVVVVSSSQVAIVPFVLIAPPPRILGG